MTVWFATDCNDDLDALEAGLKRCMAPPDQAQSLPPISYSSDTVAKFEAARVFHTGWIGLGRADQISSPGEFVTMDIAGAPIILLRDKQQILRVFANTCRHRGARLLRGDGKCPSIRCPFHSWAYGLDGRLAAAPNMDGAIGFDKSEYGLIEFDVAERAGFVFVSLADAAPDLDDWLGDFGTLHAPWSLPRLRSARRRSFDVACNWKIFLEVFNEYYHLPFVHPDTLGALYNPPDPPDDANGAYASQFGETEGTGGLLEGEQEHALPIIPGLEGRFARGVRYTWLFPNMTFAAGKEAMWVYQAVPIAPERCRVTQTICFPPETLEHPEFDQRAARYYHRLDAALKEDFDALENHQAGLISPHARAGRFSPLMEPNVAAFANWFSRQLLTS